jgi:prolyl 4-hydroxylase
MVRVGRVPFLYGLLGVVSFTSCSKQQAYAVSTSATFTLFDNGASQGGVPVTLLRTKFPVRDEDKEDAIPAGELFSLQMSKLVRVSKFGQTPGTVVATKAFREDGEKIETFEQLLPASGKEEEDNSARRIYLVADGLEFVWPFVTLGHKQNVSANVLRPLDADTGPVLLESLSETPRVFRITNMFSAAEAQALIDNALALKGDGSLARSTVGNSKEDGNEAEGRRTDLGRTSDNAWDATSPTAKDMIERSFNLTGIAASAGKVDGLQVVRYTPGQGYNTHPDYFAPGDGGDSSEFDFLPFSGGSNRWATVFMYLNDVEEGGQTVFPRVPSILDNVVEPPQYALDMFAPNTWEHRMTKECHSQLAVPPKLGTAALFYSIGPDGQIEPASHHGACPVLKGLKWGANIWIWNRQRHGDIQTGEPRTLKILNTMMESDTTVYLYWEGKEMGVLPPGKSYTSNTFEFHRFQARLERPTPGNKVKQAVFAEYTVQSNPKHQEWIVKAPRVHTLLSPDDKDTALDLEEEDEDEDEYEDEDGDMQEEEDEEGEEL